MQCPKCQGENRDARKFCGECGAKLVLICQKCGSENLPTEKFCGDCGHPIADTSKPASKDLPPKDLTFDEKLAKIQKYLPGNITEKILSQRIELMRSIGADGWVEKYNVELALIS